MSENRKYHRYTKELSVIFRYNDINHFVQAVSKNVSLGGMCLTLDMEPSITVGKILTLQFELTGHSEIVELKAIVKWLAKPDKKNQVEVGVEFTQLENPEMSSLKEKLQNLIAQS